MAINDIPKGTTKLFKFTFTDENAGVIDITGWQIIFLAKRLEKDLDAAAVINITATAGGDVADDEANGLMHVLLDSDDTDITPGELYYEFRRIVPGTPPDEKVLDAGTFGITKSIYNIT